MEHHRATDDDTRNLHDLKKDVDELRHEMWGVKGSAGLVKMVSGLCDRIEKMGNDIIRIIVMSSIVSSLTGIVITAACTAIFLKYIHPQ